MDYYYHDINKIYFNPIEDEGAMGKGIIIPTDEIDKMLMTMEINEFNLLATDRIPLNRTLPDVRMHSCQLIEYPKDLPNMSIIIIFHNEAWSVLLRTIWSIINRTPKYLLKEIILVDDASEREFLKDPLDQYIKEIPISMKIIRMIERNGIVTARILGAKLAIGDVLSFFDSHCECLNGWAEPLLHRIQENRNIIISPIIDIIDHNDFSYIEMEINRFFWISWNLGFGMGINNASDPKPIKTPIMAGGIFSVDRKYFFEMGSYDPEMKIWGGENLEMSFRIWQCGGQIEIHPCSHIAHVNRMKPPYKFPNDESIKIIETNFQRAALVWMDEWSDFYFLLNSLTSTTNFHNQRNHHINVKDRLNLRNKLNCESFSWYLKNIWPDNFFPADNRFFGKIVWLSGRTDLNDIYNEFLIQLISIPKKWSKIIQVISENVNLFEKSLDYKNDLCLKPHLNTSVYNLNETFAIVGNCISDKTYQNNFVITNNGLIMTNGYTCLNLNPEWSMGNIFMGILNKCFINKKTYWVYNLLTKQIFESGTNLCLTVQENLVEGKYFVTATTCRNDNFLYQKWALIPLNWKNKEID